MRKLSALALIAATVVSTTALAQSSHYTVHFAQSIPTTTDLLVENSIWDCGATACVLISDPKAVTSRAKTCRALKNHFGVNVVDFTFGGDTFDADKLAACNASN